MPPDGDAVKQMRLLRRRDGLDPTRLAREWPPAGAGAGRHVLDLPAALGGGAPPPWVVETVVAGDDAWPALDDAPVEPAAAATLTLTERALGGADALFDRRRRRDQDGAYKVVAFLRRCRGITTAEFGRYWEHEHAPLAFAVVPPDVFGYGYVQNHAVPATGTAPDYDGVAEMYFRDIGAMQRWSRWFHGAEGEALRADEHNFMDPAERLIVVTHEYLLRS